MFRTALPTVLQSFESLSHFDLLGGSPATCAQVPVATKASSLPAILSQAIRAGVLLPVLAAAAVLLLVVFMPVVFVALALLLPAVLPLLVVLFGIVATAHVPVTLPANDSR